MTENRLKRIVAIPYDSTYDLWVGEFSNLCTFYKRVYKSDFYNINLICYRSLRNRRVYVHYPSMIGAHIDFIKESVNTIYFEEPILDIK